MRYENVCKGIFLERPNRFIAIVEIDGNVERVHVKNTGRCRELLVPGTEVYLEDFRGRMGTRKLRYSLIAVKKGSLLINMDSQAPNQVVWEALHDGTIILPEMDELVLIKREKIFGDSRFDFYLEDSNGKKAWLEVKGVTLEENGVASFPDAPTERGIKHLKELAKSVSMGYNAYVIFVIQMKGVSSFEPNDVAHKAFGDALRDVSGRGVKVMAYDCVVQPDFLKVDNKISKINLKN